MYFEIDTDISLANEPLLQDAADSGETIIAQYMKELAANLNASEQGLLNKMVIAARVECEKYCQLSFGQKTRVAMYFPDDLEYYEHVIELPHGPISSITSIYPIDTDGTQLDALTSGSGYYKMGESFPQITIPKISSTAIGASFGDSGVKITYVCGYGASGCDTLPDNLLVAMCKQVAEWWHNRNNWIPVLHSEIREILIPYVRDVI